MRRREALLEQQPHRVALVAEGGLHADEDVAERAPSTKIELPSLCWRPGAGPHCASISRELALAADVVVGRDAGMDVGVRRRSARALPSRMRSRSASTVAGHLDRVALAASGPSAC